MNQAIPFKNNSMKTYSLKWKKFHKNPKNRNFSQFKAASIPQSLQPAFNICHQMMIFEDTAWNSQLSSDEENDKDVSSIHFLFQEPSIAGKQHMMKKQVHSCRKPKNLSLRKRSFIKCISIDYMRRQESILIGNLCDLEISWGWTLSDDTFEYLQKHINRLALWCRFLCNNNQISTSNNNKVMKTSKIW